MSKAMSKHLVDSGLPNTKINTKKSPLAYNAGSPYQTMQVCYNGIF
jgi:hypothetical protein